MDEKCTNWKRNTFYSFKNSNVLMHNNKINSLINYMMQHAYSCSMHWIHEIYFVRVVTHLELQNKTVPDKSEKKYFLTKTSPQR